MSTRPGTSITAPLPPLQSAPLNPAASAFVPAPMPATAINAAPQAMSGEEAYLRRVALSQGIPYIPPSSAPLTSTPSTAPSFAPPQISLDDEVPPPSPPSIAPPPSALTTSVMIPTMDEIQAKRNAAAAIAARLGMLGTGVSALPAVDTVTGLGGTPSIAPSLAGVVASTLSTPIGQAGPSHAEPCVYFPQPCCLGPNVICMVACTQLLQ